MAPATPATSVVMTQFEGCQTNQGPTCWTDLKCLQDKCGGGLILASIYTAYKNPTFSSRSFPAEKDSATGEDRNDRHVDGETDGQTDRQTNNDVSVVLFT